MQEIVEHEMRKRLRCVVSRTARRFDRVRARRLICTDALHYFHDCRITWQTAFKGEIWQHPAAGRAVRASLVH